MYACMYAATNFFDGRFQKNLCMHLCMDVYMYVCMLPWPFFYRRFEKNLCMHLCMYVCMYVCIYAVINLFDEVSEGPYSIQTGTAIPIISESRKTAFNGL